MLDMKKQPAIPAKDPSAKPEYPMRINRYLALKGYSTRRGADELIAKRAVTINGRRAVLGDKVSEGDDVRGAAKGKPVRYEYYAFNKPVGVVSHSPQKGEKDIMSVVK